MQLTHMVLVLKFSSKIAHTTWSSGGSQGITYTTSLDATSKDEWHFYGFEFEGTTTKLHLDGAAPITGTTGLLGQTHNRIRFDDPTIFSTGGARLAEFAVYNRALTDAEFVSIYNNGKPNGPDNVSSGRVSWFKCLSGAMATNSGSGGDFDTTITEDVDVPSSWKYTPPSLTHDGYKLSIQNITPTSTTLKYGSNTYETGSATNIYVKDTGAYTAEIGNATDFVFTSNVVSSVAQIEPVITGGYQFGHTLTYDGKLYGWGENSNGELGVNDNTDKAIPTLCTGIPQGEVVSIWKQSIRGQSRWAKTRDGRIWVTGDHDSYCLPGSSGDFTTFTDVSLQFGDYTQTSNNVVWASGSERATQVLMENGDVWSFGDDTGSLGVLGQGASPTSDRTPRKLNVSNITKITYGGDLVLALDSSNVIWMWGRNEVGNSTLGWGPYNVPTNIMSTGTNSLTSLLATDSETVVDIESSYYSMFALTDKGTVYCTGHNASGQLGQGDTTAKTSSDGWVKIEYFTSNAITVNKLYVGGGNPHVFADTSDGWYCWGENTTGELGLGDTADKLSPVKFTGVSNIKKFGVGYLVSYAITEDGKYYAWGSGSANYPRGDNTTGNISYPKYIDTLPNILAPSFEFDGYDKMASFNTQNNAPESVKFTKDIHTYDANQAQIVTVSDPGTYNAQLSGSNVFTLTSETIPATKASGLYTWAFHHGNFDNAYGDGDILTARDNGRFYADTPSYTGDIGTITPVVSSTSQNFSFTGGSWLTDGYTAIVDDDPDVDTAKKGKVVNDVRQWEWDILYNSGRYDTGSSHWLEFVPGSTTSNGTWTIVGGGSGTGTISNGIVTIGTTVSFTQTDAFVNGLVPTTPTLPPTQTIDGTIYTFTPASTLTANVLMVAGGGGGGGRYTCGGGGAGGLVYTAGTSLANGATKTIVIGNGDSGGNGNGQNGYNGKNTTFTDLDTAIGGGYGGTQGTAGGTGGSGGGGGGQTGNGTGGSGTANQGNVGGTGSSSGTFGAGGGGGSDTAGSNGSSGIGGSGGSGKFFGTGSSYTDFGDEYGEGGYFAGGGGGGTGGNAANTPGTPGRGGGGYGATYYGYMGINDSSYGGSQHALPHTGGGGGGSVESSG